MSCIYGVIVIENFENKKSFDKYSHSVFKWKMISGSVLLFKIKGFWIYNLYARLSF